MSLSAFFGGGGTCVNLLSQNKSEESDINTVSESTQDTQDDSESDGNDDNTPEFSWEPPPMPKFLDNCVGSYSEWGADTICVVNGTAYYRAYDEYGGTSIIYTLDELLCEDPTLTYDSVSSNFKSKFRISTAHKSIVVDFADRNSVKELKSLTPNFSRTKRFRKDYLADFGRNILYNFEIDFPRNRNKGNNNICKWLTHIVNKSLDNEEDVPDLNALYIGYEKRNHSAWRFKGDFKDVKAIGKFSSEKYFGIKKAEYGTDSMDYPCVLFFDLSLRLISCNDKYYSYQRYTHEYNGGAHGYYTESIVSFDPKSDEEITWDYLFKPDCEEKVLSLFFKIVQNDKKYKEWENTSSIAAIKEHFKDSGLGVKNGHIILPKPGLTDKGVTFSYQPYSISCFAAGCFHFNLPYNELKPFLTEKAKRLLNME